MSIRRASKDDAQQLKDLVSSLAYFYMSDLNSAIPVWFSTSLELAQFEARLASERFTNIIYELDRDIIGYISIEDNSHIYHLFVDRYHQGKGIARQLWSEVQKICPSSKYTVRSSMYAVPIYQKFGFIKSGIIGEKDGLNYQPMEFSIQSRLIENSDSSTL
jgi:ribosomal protein S18 acetylase RimI-like enzyme